MTRTLSAAWAGIAIGACAWACVPPIHATPSGSGGERGTTTSAASAGNGGGCGDAGCDACEEASSDASCGPCGLGCTVPNGIGSCATGSCVLSSCDDGFVEAGGVCVLDLTRTGWTLSQDSVLGPGHPDVAVTKLAPTSVTVTYSGGDVSSCVCNAQRTLLPLGKTFSCASATLAFDYHTDQSFTSVAFNAPSVQIRFLTSAMLTPQGTYLGPQFLGSEEVGVPGTIQTSSSCAVLDSNYFPAKPELHEGANTIPLGSLAAFVNGSCPAGFSTLEVHLEGYSCGGITNASTLSNLRIY